MLVLPDGTGPASETRRCTNRNQWLKPRKSSTDSNLADMGRDVVRGLALCGSTLQPVGFAGEETMVKDCGVAVVMLPGQELGT